MKPKDRLDRLVRYFPLALTGLLTLICLFFLRNLTVEELLHYTPESLPLAAAALLALYAFKSLSVVFPLSVLYVASGIIFPLWMAWLVNLGGLAVCAAIPYWVGRVSGRELARRVVAAHPKAARISEVAGRSEVFTAYLLRVVGIVPGDLAGILLGAMGMGRRSYLAGSVLGLLPGMVIQTALGEYASDPSSPVFWGLCLLMAAISLASALLYARWVRRKGEGANP